jgi:hypothetical protein
MTGIPARFPGWLRSIADRFGAAEVRNEVGYGASSAAPLSSRNTGTAGE